MSRPPIRRLSRAEGGVWLGVCAGLGSHLGWDPVLVRLGLVALAAVTSAGPGLLAAYLLAALIVPRR